MMKKIKNYSLLILMASSIAFAQQKAITDTGEQIVIFKNGTWEYIDDKQNEEYFIPTNNEEFFKPEKASFLLKSKKSNTGFWFDPKEWKIQTTKNNQETEYELQYSKGDLYAMVLTEELELPLLNLKEVAIENATNVAPDLKIANEEYRIVNGIKVLMIEMFGTMSGIKFSYMGYYFTSEKGSTQFVCYTSQNLMKKYKKEVINLLNGLVKVTD